ncbi:uncharacterized protein LOC103094482 isoform X2 [Monodelphis domestica]|uniref:uncharacterized protein LOC103094482 isoform X2 n=1 Tax=Monodelphis domestica TaxID=13616 RepID=UPI00044326EA|nr:uncharacterized protein LOC103094482 isoform X2 [Monodelphis domestica]
MTNETSELKKPMNLMIERPVMKQYHRWALLISIDHTWEQYIGIWQDCLTENCWTDIFIWPALQTAQGFMITAVLCSFLLTAWLYGFFCTSPSLKIHCHLVFIVLSFLAGSCLFIAILLIMFVLEKVNASYNTYYIFLWPFYMLWIAFVLFLISCVLGSFSYKESGQRKRRITNLIRSELSVGNECLKTFPLPKTQDEILYPPTLQEKRSSLVNWTTDSDIYGAFGDL